MESVSRSSSLFAPRLICRDSVTGLEDCEETQQTQLGRGPRGQAKNNEMKGTNLCLLAFVLAVTLVRPLTGSGADDDESDDDPIIGHQNLQMKHRQVRRTSRLYRAALQLTVLPDNRSRQESFPLCLQPSPLPLVPGKSRRGTGETDIPVHSFRER